VKNACQQDRAVAAAIEVFGAANVADLEERKFRFVEEVFELTNALDIPYPQMCAALAYEYFKRQKGSVPQEIAGVQTTLYGLANALGIDVEIEANKEIARILENKVAIQAKHNRKPAQFVAQRVA
jgi:NTP pyrophosphatase (non-canonical NTP hydrolase)